jgi:hypothetical protein
LKLSNIEAVKLGEFLSLCVCGSVAAIFFITMTISSRHSRQSSQRHGHVLRAVYHRLREYPLIISCHKRKPFNLDLTSKIQIGTRRWLWKPLSNDWSISSVIYLKCNLSQVWSISSGIYLKCNLSQVWSISSVIYLKCNLSQV